jgi:5-methyltetrahydropteroyltriglutamate--homocysteine methyltransferase
VRHERSVAPDGWWRPDPDVLPQAITDAIRLAVSDQERAGLDLVTDGEQGRQTYARHLPSRLIGVDAAHYGRRTESPPSVGFHRVKPDFVVDGARVVTAPRIVGPLDWPGPLGLDEIRFLKRQTRRPVKYTVPGPLTAYKYLIDEHYGDEEAATMALAAALNHELRALDAEGVDLLQIDEPYFHSLLEQAQRFGAAALNRMIEGVRTPVAVHICYGYDYFVDQKAADPDFADCLGLLAACDIQAISLEYEQPGHMPELLAACGDKHVILGLLHLGTEAVETPEHIASRIRDALAVVPPERLHPAPDCGMWHLSRDVAFAKVRALALGSALVRLERGL